MTFTFRTPALIAASAVLALGLTACSASEAEETAPQPVVEETAEAEETAEDTADVEAGAMPEWGEGSLDVGEKIGAIDTDSWHVDVYQVGTGVTDKNSLMVDAETNLLPAGSEVVYVNFVFTNTTDEEIPLSISLGSPQIASTSWAYLGGQPSFTSSAGYEALGLSDDGKQVGFDAPFLVAPGQSFAQATNFAYVPGDESEAEVGLIQVDDAGELLHDTKEEGAVIVTIK